MTADFNSDGKLDLAMMDGFGIGVLFGTGTGAFGPLTALPAHPTGAFPFRLITDDLNADGKLDLVTANVFGDNISVFLGSGTGTFAPRSRTPRAGAPRTW